MFCLQGWSWECLDDWKDFMRLGLPSVFMVALEWLCCGLGVFLLGK